MAEQGQDFGESGPHPLESILGATLLVITMIALIREAKSQGKTLDHVLAHWEEIGKLAPALWRSGSELPSLLESLKEKVSKTVKICPGYTDGRGVSHLCGKPVYREGAGGFTPDRCPECNHKHKNVKIAQAVKRQRQKKRAAALTEAMV